jgi:predicted DNA-binding protein (MmcQ/YjbR family)
MSTALKTEAEIHLRWHTEMEPVIMMQKKSWIKLILGDSVCAEELVIGPKQSVHEPTLGMTRKNSSTMLQGKKLM